MSKQLIPLILTEGQIIIEIDPQYFRPTEVEMLLGDRGKARKKLGWESELRVIFLRTNGSSVHIFYFDQLDKIRIRSKAVNVGTN